MRAIWFILKLPLKILMAPVILSLTLFVWICTILLYCTGMVLGLAALVVALLGVTSFYNSYSACLVKIRSGKEILPW